MPRNYILAYFIPVGLILKPDGFLAVPLSIEVYISLFYRILNI